MQLIVQGLEKCYAIAININLTVDNLKASIVDITNIPASEFKLIIHNKYPPGNTYLKDLKLA